MKAGIEKWIGGPGDEKAVADGCWFDEAAAEHVREFFRRFLRHSKGRWAGRRFELLPWQWKRVVAPLFGWKREDGRRRFRRAYVEVGKKNGKSTLCAGISLYMLVGDGEQGAEVYSAAADRDQASIVYGEAANMVRASPPLSKHIMVVESRKRLFFPRTKSLYRALSADVPTKEGLNIHLLTFDELHAQRTRDLWDTLVFGGVSREQPLTIAITTAGWNRQSICWEQHQYAEGVATGRIPDWTFLPVIYAADPEKDEWTEPATWAKANPSLGETVQVEELAEACREAQEMPTKRSAFRRYRLNLWERSEVTWMPADKWDACAGRVNPKALHGRECFGGLDLSSITDLTALALVFPPVGPREKWKALCWFWVPEVGAHRRQERDAVPYLTWAEDGRLRMTPGEVVDYDRIRKEVNALGEKYSIREIAFDRWNATQLGTQLDGDGFTMVPFGQGFASMSAPMKELEKMVLGRTLLHGGDPVLAWMAGNVTAEQDAAGNIKPSKKKSTERIDGIVALVMGIGRATVHLAEAETPPSVYEHRGILTV